jgi:uncharacterized protein YaiL (DUF2058 family)
MALNGRLSLANAPNLSAVIDGEDFDMVEFFEQCDNFGQQVIKKENVSGRLDCQLAIDAFWDNEWNFIDKNLYVLAHLSIHEGRIKGLKMLDNFSTYVKSEDLKDIKFNTLENWFEVSNRTLRIPAMNIKSNALQLTLSGSHSFDNYINYNVKINAANIVYARLKKSGTDTDLQEQLDQNGLLDMYFNLNGSIDKYKVQMSRKIVKGDFEESVLLKKKIQARLQSLLKGKQIPLPDQEITEEFKTVSNIPKNHVQKNHRSTTEKMEYIDGF